MVSLLHMFDGFSFPSCISTNSDCQLQGYLSVFDVSLLDG